MIEIFVDTNVIIDFLGDRKPFEKYAAKIFSLASDNKISIFTSSTAITTCYYILSKYIDEKQSKYTINELLDYINVIPVNSSILRQAFKSSFKDVEDAVQHYCALTEEKIKYLVTRNIKDYKHSEIDVITPEEFLRLLQ